MIPEISNTTDIFLSFWAIFCPFTPLTTKKKTPGDIIILCMSTINTNSWDMECVSQFFFSFWAIFCPFTPPHSLKNENFKKMEKMLGDKILLKCTKTHDHKLYCSWDMACDGCNCCFLFWAIFCPFTHLTLQKMKISKKWKKTPGDILHNCTKSYDYRLYCSWDMACDGCHCYFSFWAIFCTFTP